MREFFRGRKRKVGVVTLLLACALRELPNKLSIEPAFRIGINCCELTRPVKETGNHQNGSNL